MVTNDTEKLVNLLNNLINEAVEDGADRGGAYHNNQYRLSNVIQELLSYLNLYQDYEVFNTKNYCNYGSNLIIKAINKE